MEASSLSWRQPSFLRAFGILVLAWAAVRLPPLLLGESSWAPIPGGLSGFKPLEFLFKELPALLADLGFAGLLYAMLWRLKAPASGEPAYASRAFWAALAWLVFPIPSFLSAMGSGASLSLLCVLAAAWYLEFSSNPRSDLLASLAFSLALCLQPWTLVFMPALLKSLSSRREQLRFTLLLPLLPLALLYLNKNPPFLAMDYGDLFARGHGQLGLREALKAVFWVTSSPLSSLEPIVSVLENVMLAGLGGLWLLGLLGSWRPPLLPFLCLSAMALTLVAPSMDLAPMSWVLGLSLLIPGRLSLRIGILFSLALLSLNFFYPATKSQDLIFNRQPGDLGRFVSLLWLFLNLGLLIFLFTQARGLYRLCRRPGGRLEPTP